MGLADNLIQGFASAAGATDVSNRIQQKKDRAQQMSDDELRMQGNELFNNIKQIQDRGKLLNPDSPSYSKDRAANKAELDEANQSFNELFHPMTNPGNFQRLGGFIRAHVPIWQKQQQDAATAPPATPQEARQRLQQHLSNASAAAAEPAPVVNPILKQRKEMTDAGFTPEQIADKEKIDAGLAPKPGVDRPDKYSPNLVETTDSQGVKHHFAVSLQTGDAKEVFPGQEVTPKATPAGHSKFNEMAGVYEKQWGKKISDWTPDELSFFNQKMAFDSQHSGQSTTTRLEKDDQGNIHPIEITSTRGPMRPPVDPHGVATTPGGARSKVAAVAGNIAGSRVKEGAPLSFHALTPAVTKAQNDYDDSVKLSTIADQVAKNPSDAVNQKRLAVALERTSAGRFTTQALDYILKAGIANSIEGWANKAGSGALPADIMRQLIDGAHQNTIASKAALDQARGVGTQPTTAQPTGKAVSLKAAKLLPSMKGKTDEQIRQAIEAAGHKVID